MLSCSNRLIKLTNMQRWCKQDNQRSRSLNKLQRWCRIWVKSKRKSLSKCLKYRLKPKTSKSLDLLRFRSLVELKKPTCKVSTTLRRSLNSPNSKRQRTIVYTMTTSVMLNKRQSRRSRFQMPKLLNQKMFLRKVQSQTRSEMTKSERNKI